MRRAAVVLAALPLVLAACGGGGSKASEVQLTPTAYVMQSAKKSAGATSQHVTLSATAAVQGQKVVLTGAGDFSQQDKVGAMTVHANIGGLDVQIDEVLSGTTIYMKAPLFAASLPQGKTWMKLDLQKLGTSQGLDFGSLLGQDPSQSFDSLRASTHVTEVGDETIDGTDTTHYRGRIDAAKLPAALKKLRVTYRPYDVWIGKDDGYVRRMRTSYSAAGQTIATTMNFSDFGKDVTVDVPPADQTADMTDQSLQGLGG